MSDDRPLVCLTGATGYVGGRLLPLLEKGGHRLRLLARRPDSLRGKIAESTEIVRADVLDDESLSTALDGVDVVYYLIHAMGAGGDFERRDREAAENFAAAAKAKGVRRIIYLGGLGDSSQELSAHLRSRQEVGQILRESGAEVVELRASVVIGSGSLSFELIRSLVERLPVMICPRWVSTATQPIAIEDLLAYLLASLDLPAGESRIYEIGGPDRVSYGDLMREYARQRDLRRWMISVPVLTPYLSSLWLGLVTPVYARVGRKLIEGVRNPTVVTDRSALDAFDIRPMGLADAIGRALVNEDREYAETRWSDAFSSGGEPKHYGGERFGGRIIDSRAVEVDVPPEVAFAPIQRIGGETGWYFGNWLWRIRGFLDLLVGGVGMRRGRRHPVEIRTGDALDFWRVEDFKAGKELLLAAEMKLPGRAWLKFEVAEVDRRSQIRQTAIFDPSGLGGLAYWYLLYPLHRLVFAGMLKNIARSVKGSGKGVRNLSRWKPRSDS